MHSKIAKVFDITTYLSCIKRRLLRVRNTLIIRKLKRQGILIDDSVRLSGTPIITAFNNSKIVIRENVRLMSLSEFTALGVNHVCVIRTLAENAEILIKNNAGMSGVVICCASRIEIGERVMLGANVMITDTDFHSLDWRKRWTQNDVDYAGKAPIIIEDDVFIGMNSCILKNVRIGEKSVIGANSVVTKDIPPYSIAAGNPARVIGRVQDYVDL